MVVFLLVLFRMALLVRAVESQSDQLKVLSRTDPLTGLSNRRTFDFELDRTIDAARLDPTLAPVSLAMIDLDHFKAFNDLHGHAAGDEILARGAGAWSAELRLLAPAATLARYGGEEFAVVLPGVTEADALRVVRRLLAITPDGQSFSAGVARWDGVESSTEVLARADRRLYEAKAAGRARVVGATVVRLPDPPLSMQPAPIVGL